MSAGKWLKTLYTDDYDLEIFQCNCGFYFGLDAAWLDNSENSAGLTINCLNCNFFMQIDNLLKKRKE